MQNLVYTPLQDNVKNDNGWVVGYAWFESHAALVGQAWVRGWVVESDWDVYFTCDLGFFDWGVDFSFVWVDDNS